MCKFWLSCRHNSHRSEYSCDPYSTVTATATVLARWTLLDLVHTASWSLALASHLWPLLSRSCASVLKRRWQRLEPGRSSSPWASMTLIRAGITTWGRDGCQGARDRALESSMKMSTSNPRSSNTNHLEICCQSSCVFEVRQKHWGKGRISNMLAEIKRWHDPSILRSNESYQVRVATYLQIVPCLTIIQYSTNYRPQSFNCHPQLPDAKVHLPRYMPLVDPRHS